MLKTRSLISPKSIHSSHEDLSKSGLPHIFADQRMLYVIDEGVESYRALIDPLISAVRHAERTIMGPNQVSSSVSLRGGSAMTRLECPASDIDISCRLYVKTTKRDTSRHNIRRISAKILAQYVGQVIRQLECINFCSKGYIYTFSGATHRWQNKVNEKSPAVANETLLKLPDYQTLTRAMYGGNSTVIHVILPPSYQLRVLDIGIKIYVFGTKDRVIVVQNVTAPSFGHVFFDPLSNRISHRIENISDDVLLNIGTNKTYDELGREEIHQFGEHANFITMLRKIAILKAFNEDAVAVETIHSFLSHPSVRGRRLARRLLNAGRLCRSGFIAEKEIKEAADLTCKEIDYEADILYEMGKHAECERLRKFNNQFREYSTRGDVNLQALLSIAIEVRNEVNEMARAFLRNDETLTNLLSLRQLQWFKFRAG